MPQPEVDVALHARAQPDERILELRFERLELFDQPREGLLAHVEDEVALVVEMEVDGGGGVLDPFRDLAH